MQPHAAPIPGMNDATPLLTRLRPYVRHCGDSWRPAWRIPARRLLDYLIVHVMEGHGRFIRGDAVCTVGPGDIFWVPPDTVHDMEGFAPHMRCAYVHFDLLYDPSRSHWDFSIPGGMVDLAELTPLMHPRLDAPELDLPPILRQGTGGRIGDTILRICQEAERAQPFHQWAMTGLLWEMLAEILRGSQGPAPELDAHAPLLEEAAAHIRAHLDEDVSIEALAAYCRMCPSYFRRLFAASYGCSPRAYVRRARIQKAKVLMMGTALSLSEVARRVGFSSVQNFGRAFRSLERTAPGDYRRCGRHPAAAVEGRATPWPR